MPSRDEGVAASSSSSTSILAATQPQQPQPQQQQQNVVAMMIPSVPYQPSHPKDSSYSDRRHLVIRNRGGGGGGGGGGGAAAATTTTTQSARPIVLLEPLGLAATNAADTEPSLVKNKKPRAEAAAKVDELMRQARLASNAMNGGSMETRDAPPPVPTTNSNALVTRPAPLAAVAQQQRQASEGSLLLSQRTSPRMPLGSSSSSSVDFAKQLMMSTGKGGIISSDDILAYLTRDESGTAADPLSAAGLSVGGQPLTRTERASLVSTTTASISLDPNTLAEDGYAVPTSSSSQHNDQRAVAAHDFKEILPQRVTGFSREQHIKYLEAYIARQCASSRPLEGRLEGYCRALDATCDMHPTLVNVYSTVKHFLREAVHTIVAERKKHAAHLLKMQQKLHMDQQQFYETKFLKNMAEKTVWQDKCKVLAEEVSALRQSRDEDLAAAKEEVLAAVKKIHEDDEEIRSIRSLVTSVFMVHKESEARVHQLEEMLLAHHIAIPPKLVEDDEGNLRPSPQQSQRGNNDQQQHKTPSRRAVDGDGVEAEEAGVSSTASSTAVSPRAARVVSPTAKQHTPGRASNQQPASPKKPSVPPAADQQEQQEPQLHYHFQAPRLQDQVSIDFIEASKRELEQCRLSTQRVLVSCASDSQSSYKLLISQMRDENQQLKHEIQQLTEAKRGLERYVHEKRFVQRSFEDADRDEKAMTAMGEDMDVADKHRALLQRDGSVPPVPAAAISGGLNIKTGRPVPSLPVASLASVPKFMPPEDIPREQLTPRPTLPFDIQPVLGVDLRQSTSRITAELSTVALNLKKQLDEMHARVRRLATCVTWMDEWTTHRLVDQDDAAFLPTATTAQWDQTHHFLRTTVQPHVPNLKWTAMFAAHLVCKFFESFDALREASRRERDLKMLAPRTLQPFERRYFTQVRLDATSEELLSSSENVPIGYIVTEFLLRELGAASSSKGNTAQDMTQSRVTATKFIFRVADPAVELELAKVAYNLWYSARKYRAVQPICDLFVQVVENRLPRSIYDAMKQTQALLTKRVTQCDAAKTGSVTYHQLTTSMHALLSDQEPELVRGALFAAAQMLEQKQISSVGTISLTEMLSDENRTLPRRNNVDSSNNTNNTAPGGPSSSGQVNNNNNNNTFSPLLANAAQSSLPTAPSNNNMFAGASLLVRYFRRLVIQKHVAIIRHMEALAYPLVEESRAVRGMFLLKVSAFEAVLTQEDNAPLRSVGNGWRGLAPPSTAAPMATNRGALTLQQHPLMMSQGSISLISSPLSGAAPSVMSPVATAAPGSMPVLLDRHAVSTPLTGAGGRSGNASMNSPLPAVFTQHVLSKTPGGMDGDPLGTAVSPTFSNPDEPRQESPPFLHVAHVPICLGDVVSPQQLLVRPGRFVANFSSVLGRLQRYSSSVHFPVEPSSAVSQDGNGGGAAKGGGGGGKRRRSFTKKNNAQDLGPLTTDDQDWVEWYHFLHALRTSPLILADQFVGGVWPPPPTPATANTSGGDPLAPGNTADKQPSALPPLPSALL